MLANLGARSSRDDFFKRSGIGLFYWPRSLLGLEKDRHVTILLKDRNRIDSLACSYERSESNRSFERSIFSSDLLNRIDLLSAESNRSSESIFDRKISIPKGECCKGAPLIGPCGWI